MNVLNIIKFIIVVILFLWFNFQFWIIAHNQEVISKMLLKLLGENEE